MGAGLRGCAGLAGLRRRAERGALGKENPIVPSPCGAIRNDLVSVSGRTSHGFTSMQEIISIRDANQHLTRYLERVEQGTEIIITRRGKPIARLLPVEQQPRLSETQQAARERIRARMQEGYALGGVRLDRETLHERG